MRPDVQVWLLARDPYGLMVTQSKPSRDLIRNLVDLAQVDVTLPWLVRPAVEHFGMYPPAGGSVRG